MLRSLLPYFICGNLCILTVLYLLYTPHTTTSTTSTNSTTTPTWDPAFTLPPDPSLKLILLLTSFRGGSSFLGQLFDSNPALQYHFEPFYDLAIRDLYSRGLLLGAAPHHTEADLRMLYLQQILHNCSVYGSWFPERYEFCGDEEESDRLYGDEGCDRKRFKWGTSHQQICRHRKTIVMKVIRQRRLTDLLKIRHIRDANIKVVHLVRHPVPVTMSRRTGVNFFSWDRRTKVECECRNIPGRRVKQGWEVYEYCRDHHENVRAVERGLWGAGQYMRVTHKELSLDPLGTAGRVYQFVGEALTEGIRGYLLNITQGTSDGFRNRRKDGLEVFKNTTEVLDQWMNLRSSFCHFWDVYSIEAMCRSVLGIAKETFSVDISPFSKLIRLYEYPTVAGKT